jgi:integrase
MTIWLELMSKTKPVKQWPPIYTQTNRSGQPSYYVDLRAVGGGRPAFPDLAQAETRAEQARIQKSNEGTAAFALPLHVRVDAAKAHAILSPHGISILEVANYYNKHVLAYKSAPVIKDIVERYIANSVKRNLRPRTVEDLKHRLNTFASDFGESRLSEVSLDELKEWVMDDGWEPRTRINSLTKISQLYGYAIRNKWADSNIAASIDRPMVDETTPEIFTVEKTESLLNHANEFGLLPYVAIGFFAGVRSAELMRMTAKNINFETKTIVVGADAAKKRSQRIIEISPALLGWLELCKGELQNGERLIETNKLRKNKPLLLVAAEIENWPANGLRHSFGSYHLAMFQNIEQTANQMGNSAAVIHKHYKALVTKDVAEKYWNLKPN